MDAHDVEVKVQDGEVTLTGTVPSRAERWRLEEVADGAFGVTDVRNDVRVSRPEEPSMGQPGPGDGLQPKKAAKKKKKKTE